MYSHLVINIIKNGSIPDSLDKATTQNSRCLRQHINMVEGNVIAGHKAVGNAQLTLGY